MVLTKVAGSVKTFTAILIAIVGGYAFTSGYVAFFSVVLAKLGMEKGEAIMLSTMTGFIVYLCVILWIFTTQKMWRTSTVILLMAVVMIIVSPYLAKIF